MKRTKKNDMLVAIDLGTENVRTIIAEAAGDRLDIIGVGRSRTSGLKRGMVMNMEATTAGIRQSVEEAELMAGRDVSEALCNITGSHVRSQNKNGVASVGRREVRPDDVGRVLKVAQEVRIGSGRDFVHLLPIDFTVDDNYGLKSPVGIAGVRLETNVHIITAARPAMDNIITCCNREGIRVSNLVFSPLASSQVLLHEDEKELGVVLIDIGAGTAEYVVWFQGSIIQSGVIPVGGAVISNELAVALRTPKAEADRIKIQHGAAMASKVPENETVDVPSVGGREPESRPRRFLAGVVEPILDEVFATIAEEIQRAGNDQKVPAGVVLTGGTSQMAGVADLAEFIMGIRARVGEVKNVSTDDREELFGGVTNVVADPSYATCLGMLLLAHRDGLEPVFEGSLDERNGWWGKFRKWVKEAFV